MAKAGNILVHKNPRLKPWVNKAGSSLTQGFSLGKRIPECFRL